MKRAGDVLKDLYLTFREATFENVVEKVEINKNGELEIWDGNNLTKETWFIPFPNNLVDAQTKNGLLTTLVCEEPLAVLKTTIEKLFAGMNLCILLLQ